MHHIRPEGWKRGKGFSHAIRVGDRVLVSGVLPWDPNTQQVADTRFGDQWGQALRNLRELLLSAGLAPENVTLLRIFVTSIAAYNEAHVDVARHWSEVLGSHFPVVTMVEINGLVDP